MLPNEFTLFLPCFERSDSINTGDPIDRLSADLLIPPLGESLVNELASASVLKINKLCKYSIFRYGNMFNINMYIFHKKRK